MYWDAMHWQEKLRRSGALYTMLERLERENSRAVYQEGGPLLSVLKTHSRGCPCLCFSVTATPLQFLASS